MKKDAYYFPHFSNARNDSKILKLKRVFGIEGYGIYFMLLEVLRDQTSFKYPIDGIEDLAYEWRVSKEKIMSVVCDFDLFTIQDDEFLSLKQIQYLQPYIAKSERARQAALKRWGDANAHANALQKQNKCNADQNAKRGEEKRGEERKGEESKEQEGSQSSPIVDQNKTDSPRKPKSKKPKKNDFTEKDIELVYEALGATENAKKLSELTADFLIWKKEAKKGAVTTERGLKAHCIQLLKLSRQNEDLAAEIYQNSMANNYAGIFEPKTTNLNKADDYRVKPNPSKKIQFKVFR